ncbi:MAG: RimK/LysX family protein, partial [Flavobacteriales bacterium]
KLTTIVRHLRVSFPDLGFTAFASKLDPGAFRTVIHCERCREIETDQGVVLEADFKLEGTETRTLRFNDFFSKEFKSSFGEKEKRFCVKTTIKIGKKKIKSSVSLTDRSDMKFQVLIGRKTLLRKFVVDVSKKFA